MSDGDLHIDPHSNYPILIIPKQCTILEIGSEMSENVFIDLTITSPDTEGNATCVYSGYCHVKLIDTNDINSLPVDQTIEIEDQALNASLDFHDIEQMPVILAETNQFPYQSDDQSQVWIDPSRSPYVYNQYDRSSQNTYSIREASGCITFQQHNTFITQNVYKYAHSTQELPPTEKFVEKRFKKKRKQRIPQKKYYYDDSNSESELLLSQIAKEKSKKRSKVMPRTRYAKTQGKNDALMQLMSSEIQSSSKAKKTIMYLGSDSSSGQTIQNISYSDPAVQCTELQVDDNKSLVEDTLSTVPKKKKYQCDKCKQIFDHISMFRQHMTGQHTYTKTVKSKISYKCTECGRNIKNYQKFRKHCLGHGNPSVECPKCHNVYASNTTLKLHMKIHDRNFPCAYCKRRFATADTLKTHMKKSHFMVLCQYDEGSFNGTSEAMINDHHDDHINNDQSDFCNTNQEVMLINNSDTDLPEAFPDFEKDLINLSGALKNEMSDGNEGNVEKIREADSVIAKVMSNKIFLLNSKSAVKHGRSNKVCQVCSKSFDRVSDLKRHLIEHVIKSSLAKSISGENGLLDLSCEICQRESFDTIDKYKAHLREHAKLTIYKCTFCDKSFSDSSNFSKHKKIHGVSYYHCDLCQRKFNSKKMITQHMELHNKHKPVKCKICSRHFHFKSMLNKHLRTSHRMHTTRGSCRFCDGVFETLKEKWDHEWVVHNIRKLIVDCWICGSKFRKFAELKRHFVEIHGMDIRKLQRKKTTRVKN